MRGVFVKMKISVLFFIIGILGLIFLGYMHEQVHVTIYESYGIKSKVEYFKGFPNFVTIPEAPCPNDACILSNNENEAIGYHALPFYFLLLIGIFTIIMFLEDIEDKL